MPKTITFIRQYPVFGLVAVSMMVAAGLELGGARLMGDWLLLTMCAIAVIQIVIEMLKTLRQGGLGLDILALTAIVVGLLMHEYWAAVVIALMLTGGEALEDYAERRATRELSGLLDRAPTHAHVVQGTTTTDVPVNDVAVGDLVRIKPGEVVPVDGTLAEGTTSIDESSLTGESLPVTKQPGDEILSGAVNVDAAITIKTLRVSAESQYAQIIQLVQEATSAKSPFVRLADRYSLPFTAISFAIAFAAWAISGSALRFLEVIVVATPCPLLIGAPVAIISGMSRAAKHGIMVKNGASLERLASIKSIAFDKTGTLTQGKPTLERVEPFTGLSEAELLSVAAAVEADSTHILAAAVTAAAAEQQLRLPAVEGITEEPGFGLRATWQGKQVLIGRYDFLQSHHVAFPAAYEAAAPDQTVTFMAIDGQAIGALHFRDERRADAAQTITELREQGLKHILMLTGDNPQVAKRIANEVGISEVYASLLPKDKVLGIQRIDKSYRPSGMVGDGVNDAPVLAASDVGIALGARGSTAASQSADVVIMLDDLHRVAQAVQIARQTIQIGLQSVWVGIVISIGLMLVFATGRFPAVLGAALQEIVDVVVILNALRAHGGSLGQTLFEKVKLPKQA